MGMFETLLFGGLALIAAVIAIYCLRSKPSIISLLLGICIIPFVFISGYNWRLALIDSGKNPAWLGFHTYPFALITLIVLSVIALVSIFISVSSIIKRRK